MIFKYKNQDILLANTEFCWVDDGNRSRFANKDLLDVDVMVITLIRDLFWLDSNH